MPPLPLQQFRDAPLSSTSTGGGSMLCKRAKSGPGLPLSSDPHVAAFRQDQPLSSRSVPGTQELRSWHLGADHAL